MLTYEGDLFGGSWLQVHAVLQPQEFGIWDAVSVAVEAGRDAGLLGLRFRIDQDHWRDWTRKRKTKTTRTKQAERERERRVKTQLHTVSW